MIEFINRRYPAFYIAAGRGYKFRAQSLMVNETDAAYVRAYALLHPQSGIVEVLPAPPPPAKPVKQHAVAPVPKPAKKRRRARPVRPGTESEQVE